MSPDEVPTGSAELLNPQARQERIRDRVLELGSARIEDLARELGVSVMTIHRDLDRLADEGWLRKTRGAATAQQSVLFESNVRYRTTQQGEAKKALAGAALEHIDRGQAILLDDSTTSLALARALPESGPLTVITNFLAIVNALAGRPGIELISLGGSYDPHYDAFQGMATCDHIKPLRADTVFISTSAVADGHCYHQSQEAILVKRALLEAAQRRILLVDHTKFRKRALHRVAPLSDFDLVIVDDRISRAELEALREDGVTVQVAALRPGPPES
ncbi:MULTISPECIES: DeoR/GlpR family DNA-binding transcription regulator [unclassified Streptomyces]|uniref:DeoR/GlpR family DNA-binding transcription regulator n=1 Tax=unclassified Streptomyces TaxID=2593676 RepID=UPI00225678D6|nr:MULTISPECIES: DeoR/GlpR family DNA-binding transcription regulator [unclassified Streptomyces]MCX4835195.1 DeoR/GlpR family DNA-binding transcription regulator [Streptomyces sp. NBC_01016]